MIPTLVASAPERDNPFSSIGPSHPRYFSGTGCEVDSLAIPASGYLTHAQLCIWDNGHDQVVKEYWDTNATGKPTPLPTDGSVVTGTNNTTGATLNALFDSTHFLTPTMIVLKLKVWDSNGGYYEGEIQGQAYNTAYVLANSGREVPSMIYHNTNFTPGYLNDFDDPNGSKAQNLVSIVSHRLQNMKHIPLLGTQDDKSAILLNLPVETAFYIYSHADPGVFADCIANGYDAKVDPIIGHWESEYILSASDVSERLNINRYDYTPYNFVYIDGCSSAGVQQDGFLVWDTSMANAFRISSRTDAAFLGWMNDLEADQKDRAFTECVYQNLANQQTISDSVKNSLAISQATPVKFTPSEEIIKYPIPTIFGDNRMKLHGVYNGVAGNWFKSL